MAKINFGGVVEDVITREEFPLKKAQEILKNEVVAVIGYGVQGPAQAIEHERERYQCDYRSGSRIQIRLG